jgi:hypothetical protein
MATFAQVKPLRIGWSGRGRTADLLLFSQAANHPNLLQPVIIA